jgi:hypothetical protein
MYVRVGVRDGDFVGETEESIQRAVNAAVSYGGGTVEIGPGTYLLHSSIRLGRSIRVVGAGADTVLRKCPGAQSKLLVDADFGQMKVTAADPSGFAPGMEVAVLDDQAWGYAPTVARVTLVQGKTIYLNRALVTDYAVERAAEIVNGFSLVAAVEVDSVVIEGLTLDGARNDNPTINGCIGGGIYLYRARKCHGADCAVMGFGGDGISSQTTQDIVFERCDVHGCAGLGIHRGTGSERTIVRDCRAHGNDEDGIYLCYWVQGGAFEGNEVYENGQFGISIGHKDTDNTFTRNRIYRNRSHGICFRDENASNAGSRNVFRENMIEDNGGCGVYIGGRTANVVFEANTIRDTRSGADRTQLVGVCASEHTADISLRGNRIENNVEAATRGQMEIED